MSIKQQTAEQLKHAAQISIGAVGTGATWGLSEVATGVSIMVGLATFAYMCSMVWLNIKKGKQLDKTGSTRFPNKPQPPAAL